MGWVRLDDKMAFNAKIVLAGNAATGALVRMLTYSADYRTNGFVAAHMAKIIAVDDETLQQMLDVRMLERADCGFLIHEWQQGILTDEERKAKREAGARGGAERAALARQARAQAESKHPPSTCLDSAQAESKHPPSTCLDSAQAESKHPPSRSQARARAPDPDPDPDPDPIKSESESESTPPPTDLTSLVERELTLHGADMWAAEMMRPEVAGAARRIANELENHPKFALVPVAEAIRECVEFARVIYAEGKSPSVALARTSQKMRWILRDYQTGNRLRVAPLTPRLTVAEQY